MPTDLERDIWHYCREGRADEIPNIEERCSEFKEDVQKWIPVTEKLPEESGRYLCTLKSVLFRNSTYQMVLVYCKGGFHDGCICMENITHWMPLPEPPEEVE